MTNTDFEIIAESQRIASELENVLRGHTTAAAYLAIGIVLALIQAEADKPDVDGLPSVLRKVIGEQLGESRH